ncbi:MAG: hypothetical protein ACI4HM_05175 [Ruminococcus sp.]
MKYSTYRKYKRIFQTISNTIGLLIFLFILYGSGYVVQLICN